MPEQKEVSTEKLAKQLRKEDKRKIVDLGKRVIELEEKNVELTKEVLDLRKQNVGLADYIDKKLKEQGRELDAASSRLTVGDLRRKDKT